MRRAFDWLFRHRGTGKVVVGQWPNLALGTWIACTVFRILFDPTGVQRSALAWVGGIALVVWAIDEIARGVNPFRRIVGGVVLLGLVLSRV